ncbi:phosphatidate cytidylyltransferase [Candidatus Palibaumannia cicadellinicola]|uniref:Phosphatidate cytidylyltransferase n=1 Tax=Candidatus Palibaumannia cicadellinicola TaxID=186490 RepID=A0A0K2BL72_9GAMM|nr:phosphatidate cytidylyltransferase [Candidatus Baumannia cicadellinicola]AKZ66065.1 Phosphatidate cytidylyltransferase [Candidatus Baumannia cicadellinicola]
MLNYRFITACILVPIVIGIIFIIPPIVFKLIILIVCMLSAWEWGQLAGLQHSSQRCLLVIFFCLLINIISLLINKWNILNKYILWSSLVWWITALLLVISYPRSAGVWRSYNWLRLVFGGFTIIPFLLEIIHLRDYNYNSDHFIGSWLLLYLMLIVWSADSGAYIFGSILGRHKLSPKISPGKTWEGLISGILISEIIMFIFSKYAKLPSNYTQLKLIIYSTVVALVSVLGDLTESMFKREAGIKDSGYIIPGHGGILDRIDSFTSAVPVFVFLIDTTGL